MYGERSSVGRGTSADWRVLFSPGKPVSGISWDRSNWADWPRHQSSVGCRRGDNRTERTDKISNASTEYGVAESPRERNDGRPLTT